MNQLISARALEGAQAVARMPLEISCSTRPRVGQTECSVRCGWWATPFRIVMAIADGLGLGAEAEYAAEVTIACIGAGLERPFEEIFTACSARLRGGRGVALAVAVVDLASGKVTMASVGDIRVVFLTGNETHHLRNTKGIVGGDYDQVIPETKTLSRHDVLVLFSNGLNDFFPLRDTLARVPPFSRDHARVVLDRWAPIDEAAAVLFYRHFA